jgi:hypothetical protein
MRWAGWHRGSVAQQAISEHDISQISSPPIPRTSTPGNTSKKGRSEVTHNRFISKIETVAKELVDYLNATRFIYSLLSLRSI